MWISSRGNFAIAAITVLAAALTPTTARATFDPRVAGQATVTAVTCDGDGVSGKRVQLLYLYGTEKPNRLSTLLSSFRQMAAQIDAAFVTAAKQNGAVRHVRFVHDGSCQPIVTAVQIFQG